jgi:hypothetical protein
MNPFSRKFVVLSYQKTSDEAIAQKIFLNFKRLGKSHATTGGFNPQRTVGHLPSSCGKNALIRALFDCSRRDNTEGRAGSYSDTKHNNLALPIGVAGYTILLK